MLAKLRRFLCSLAVVITLVATADLAWAQPGLGTTGPAPLTDVPSLNPVPSNSAPGAASTSQPSALDPYAPPSLLSPGATPGYGTPSPGFTQPFSYSQPGMPALNPQPYPGQQPAPGFGYSSPPVLFPQGLLGPSQPGGAAAYGGPLKLFQHARVSHEWLNGESGADLRSNDTFLTTTLAMPNFLWTGQPWFLSPGFGLHLWSGPWVTTGPARFFPSKAYSAFVDVGWESDPQTRFGVEASGRIGVFTDFEHVETESLRPMGLVLLRYNMTTKVVLKAGVDYINRADVKLLPAGGIVWTPNSQTRFDIYFPQPKFASYLTTLGNWDLWWYVAGEYGGGVWTLRYDGVIGPGANSESLTDINDLRLMIGLELGPPTTGGLGQRGIFFEVGYVWDREIVVVAANASQRLSDTIMLRGGIAF